MLIGQPQLGFSITAPFKAVGRGVVAAGKAGYSVVSDPRVQRAAVSAAQAYAPAQYAQATQYADRARGILAPGGGGPMPAPMPVAPMPMAPMPGGDDDMAPVGPGGGVVQKGNFVTIAAIVGAGLVIFLLLRK